MGSRSLRFSTLDEVGAPRLGKHNQAFIIGGDIMRNVIGMREAFQRVRAKRQLHLRIQHWRAGGSNWADVVGTYTHIYIYIYIIQH